MILESDVEIACYSPILKMIVGHHARDDEFKARVSAITHPHLIYFFVDHRYITI